MRGPESNSYELTEQCIYAHKTLLILVVLRIYVAFAVFQPYRNLEAGDNQSLKFKW